MLTRTCLSDITIHDPRTLVVGKVEYRQEQCPSNGLYYIVYKHIGKQEWDSVNRMDQNNKYWIYLLNNQS